ncbi:hypothetical protein SK571_06585 [Lentzea sp. BCCO 10_0798]|uniref:SseB protein N-terminal domain-containing protein n=1 Tax=Lentzea kristufekii TaxID=3095430 RepID=A0ABU4TL83_9PSEU|nr:hypothetical protein [Lentzea sp. BCCO 10_0798]MDX8049040.1 hypothetical protein [Lentzea sp. BCCO 10_0798]
MNGELAVAPRDGGVRTDLGEAAGWPEYAAELRGVLAAVIAASSVEVLLIDALALGERLPEELAWLRNGVAVTPVQAVDLFVEMLGRGTSPFFRLLGADVLRIEQSWNAVVFLPMTQEVYDALDDLSDEHLEIQWRRSEPDLLMVEAPVEVVADEGFWTAVRAAAQSGTTLLQERWAFGVCGSRWFLVTPENVEEVISEVQPRSLVRVAADPDLRVRLMDRSFTAFTAPLKPGELACHEVPGGVEDEDEVAEVTGAGFDLFLAGAALDELYAVVPDADGVVRRQWEDPKQFL